jgi:Fe-S-cluster containining protein
LSDICKKCAACCKRYPFIEVSQKEIFSLKEATGVHPDLFTNRKDDEKDEYFLQFKENGFCYFLAEQDNAFYCSAYAARPGICKNFPSNPLQQEVCDINSLRVQLNDSQATPMACDSNH